MLTSFASIYKFIINITVSILGLIIAALIWISGAVLFSEFYMQIPFIILGIIAGVSAGGYLFVLLRLPIELPEKFDPIKNRVALQQYSTVREFQQDIAIFLLEAFEFRGADICAGYFNFNGAEPLYLNVDMDISSLLTEEHERVVRTKLQHGKTAFYVPVQIGNIKLGEMLVFTQGYVLPLMEELLQDFENYYLDDQLLHVINKQA